MANNTMGTGTSTATKASGSTATTPAAKAAKESTSTTPAASSSAATTATTTPSAATTAAQVNPASLKKLPSSANKPAPAQPNSFQAYLERLDAEKQISYLMLGASEVLPNFNVKRTHPYSFFFFKKKGYKQIFQPNKNIIVQEIKRRHPDAKPNQNNRSNDELMEMLRDRWPLVEPDKQYILEKEKDYRKVLLSALSPKDVIHLDEMTDLVASPKAHGLSVPTGSSSSSGPTRKRSIGETSTSSPTRNISTLAAASSKSYYATNSNKRQATSSISNRGNSGSSSLVQTMLVHAARECTDKMYFSKLAEIVEALKKERFELNLQKVPLVQKHTPPNVQSLSIIDNRIDEINTSILIYETKMGSGVVNV